MVSSTDSEDDEKAALMKTFRKLDKNGDGLISREEFMNIAARLDPSGESCFDDMFDELDVNKDGTLSYEEIVDFIFEVESLEKQASDSADVAEAINPNINSTQTLSLKLKREVGQLAITARMHAAKTKLTKDQVEKIQATRGDLENALEDINKVLTEFSIVPAESSSNLNGFPPHGGSGSDIEKMRRRQRQFAPTALYSFTIDEDLARCKGVLDRFPEAVNQSLGDGTTSMHIAAKSGHKEILKLFIAAKADLDRPDADGSTPVMVAAEHGHSEVLQLLFSAKANFDKPNNEGVTPIFKAAQNSQLDVMKFLIEKGADPSKADNNGRAPSWVAASDGHEEILKLLIGARANLDTVDKTDGETLCCAAASYGHAEILKILIAGRADACKAMDNGDTPMSIAQKEGHDLALQVLKAAK